MIIIISALVAIAIYTNITDYLRKEEQARIDFEAKVLAEESEVYEKAMSELKLK